MNNFTVLEGNIPLILHVPYSSMSIPANVRKDLLCEDKELSFELDRFTNKFTDQIAKSVVEGSTVKPWVFINNLSPYVIDVERFDGAANNIPPTTLAQKHNAVWMKGTFDQTIREPNERRDNHLVNDYYYPYENAFANVLDSMIAKYGQAVIVDIRSYDPAIRATYQVYDEIYDYPDIWIHGTHFHSPTSLQSSIWGIIEDAGYSVDVGSVLLKPWLAGYVPTPHYMNEEKVSSISINIRRDIFLTEQAWHTSVLKQEDYERLVTCLKEIAFHVGI